MAITMVSVEFEAKLDRLQSDINKAVGMLGGAGKSIQTSMGGAAAGVDGLSKSMSLWAREQGQQARVASRLVEPLSGLAEAAGVSSGAIKGLAQVFVEGAAGGVGFGLALEGAQLVVSTIVGALKRAEEEAKKTAAALRAVQDRIDAIGKTPIQQKLEEVARLRDALEEERAANQALADSGALVGSEGPEEKRLDAARKKLQEYADKYQVTTGGLRSLHERLSQELAKMEEAHRTEMAVKDAEAEEKKGAARLGTVTSTLEKIKALELAKAKEIQDAIHAAARAEADAFGAMELGNVGDNRGWKPPPLPRQFTPQEEVDSATAAELGMIGAGESARAEAGFRILKKATDDLAASAQTMGEAFGQAFAGMLSGQMSVAQGMASILKTIVNAVIDAAKKWIMADAAAAAAGAAKSTAGIPVVGPFLAAGAMVAMLSMVQGLVGQVGSAAGGWDLPSGGPFASVLHAREMVLPAKYADVIRGMAGGQPMSGASTIYNVTIHATDAGSFFRANRRTLMAEIGRAVRAGES